MDSNRINDIPAENKEERLLNSAIETIELYQMEHWFTIVSNEPLLNGLTAKVWKEEVFKCEFTLMKQITAMQREKLLRDREIQLELKNGGSAIFVEKSKFLRFESATSIGSGYTKFIAHFGEFTTVHTIPEHPSVHQAIIKCEDQTNFLGSFFIAKHLKVGTTLFGSRILKLNVGEIEFDLYLYGRQNVKENYLFIESFSEIDYSVFSNFIHEILLSITYVTGIFPGKEVYILNNSKNANKKIALAGMFRFKEDIGSSTFSIIPNLGFAIAEHNLLQNNNGIVFLENMVEKCLASESFRRTILLMTRANTQPDYIRVVLYSVALETLSAIFYMDNKERLNPISDKKLSSEILGKLASILQEYTHKLSDESVEILGKKINDLNKPTNSDLLIKPFQLLGVELNGEDRKVIKKRNDFLHGRLTSDAGSHELATTSYRLHYLISSLIMKSVNYSGAILFHASFYQDFYDLPINEPGFRMI